MSLVFEHGVEGSHWNPLCALVDRRDSLIFRCNPWILILLFYSTVHNSLLPATLVRDAGNVLNGAKWSQGLHGCSSIIHTRSFKSIMISKGAKQKIVRFPPNSILDP